MTSNRRTVQIAGIVSFLAGRLDSFFVDLHVVSGHTGLDIAHTLLEPLKDHSLTVEDITQQLWCDGWTIFHALCAYSS